jgi:hypothetical protein
MSLTSLPIYQTHDQPPRMFNPPFLDCTYGINRIGDTSISLISQTDDDKPDVSGDIEKARRKHQEHRSVSHHKTASVHHNRRSTAWVI